MAKQTLLLSVPPSEIFSFAVDRSIFDATQLLAANISEPLKKALLIIFRELAPSYRRFLCVVRPEMFVEATTLKWLNERVDEAKEHICLSDGHSLKAIPGLRNHLFFNAADWLDARERFRRNLRWAPEQLTQFVSTINDMGEASIDYRKFKLNRRILRPSSGINLQHVCWSYSLYSNPHSPEDGANRMLARGVSIHSGLLISGDPCVDIVLCSEAAMHDLNFCRVLANKINEAAFNPSRKLVIQLPSLQSGRNNNLDRLICFLSGLHRARVPIPRLELPRIQLVTSLNSLEDKLPSIKYTLTLPSSIALWQWSPAVFSSAISLTCYLGELRGQVDQEMLESLQKMLGPRAVLAEWSPEALLMRDLGRVI